MDAHTAYIFYVSVRWVSEGTASLQSMYCTSYFSLEPVQAKTSKLTTGVGLFGAQYSKNIAQTVKYIISTKDVTVNDFPLQEAKLKVGRTTYQVQLSPSFHFNVPLHQAGLPKDLI